MPGPNTQTAYTALPNADGQNRKRPCAVVEATTCRFIESSGSNTQERGIQQNREQQMGEPGVEQRGSSKRQERQPCTGPPTFRSFLASHSAIRTEGRGES